MDDENERVSIKTTSRYFWHAKPSSYGAWTAGLLWTEDGVNALLDIETGKTSDTAEGAQITGDVLAVLAGLRKAKSMGMDAVVYSVNDSVVRTIPEHYARWRDRKWRTGKGKTPDSLDEWHQINEICQSIDVRWERRRKSKVDEIEDHEEFDQLLKARDNDFWMERAISRDT